MDWLLTTPEIQSAFAALGTQMGDTYLVSTKALAVLEEINCKLMYEDTTLRTYRRAIGFGQYVRAALIPLLANAKDPEVLDALIRILVNLTVPVECLFSVDVMYRTEAGRHTIFEINKLLLSSKEAFADAKSTKSVVDYMKFILENETKLSTSHCDTINNCLLLLRNILHIPESNANFIVSQGQSNPATSMQNIILWNLFIQSADKILIYLMSCPRRAFWSVTMVQLIAVMYKDQHISTLQKLLNSWVEASLSESSEDNESNTSPPNKGSGDSSPMLTSDPTSDSSDNGGGRTNTEAAEDRRQALSKETEATLQEVSRKGHEYQISILRIPSPQAPETEATEPQHPAEPKEITSKDTPDPFPAPVAPSPPSKPVSNSATDIRLQPPTCHASPARNLGQKSPHSGHIQLSIGKSCPQKRECPSSQSELSDCGYGTQVEHQESISTSSNDDDGPHNKPVHQKPPCNQKQRSKSRVILSTQENKDLRRKKLVKRSKSSLINMKGLVQHTPTDEDIANILKEFTVDFLLKGYGYLVQSLHAQLLTDNQKVKIDTSHFFWLVTYFLKFATQLELDMEHLYPLLNFKIISYLTYEGVRLSEQLELTSRQMGSDLKPCLRRMHLVVTAIREFLQAIECYKKITHLTEDDKNHIQTLQNKIGATEDLRCLFILLLRKYNSNLHTKQYLQDLIVTNHMLLLILDGIDKSGDRSANNIKIAEHVSQFATVEIMHHYGQLLEDFHENGAFVNDCIFTMMHHVGGDLGQIMTLFQPAILKTFTRIWQTDYELCDDWSDLIEYVIHKFMNTPQKSSLSMPNVSLTEMTKEHNLEHTLGSWPEEDMDTLYWYYVQSKKTKDIVGKIESLFNSNLNKQKSRISIIQQLLQQDIITLVEYDDLMKFEDFAYQRTLQRTPSSSTAESGIDVKDSMFSKASDDVQILRNLVINDGKEHLLVWLQKVLLECCYVKLCLESESNNNNNEASEQRYIMEPVAHHCILKNKSISIVTWNTEQASIMQYQPFVLLLHKLGFHLPADAGSVYARIPEFWSADIMFDVAKKLGPINKSTIKFDLSLFEKIPEAVNTNAEESGESDEGVDKHTISADDNDNSMEVFAVPKAKQNNSSFIRCTPYPQSTPTIPNWLQLVMRNKCTSSERLTIDTDPAHTAVTIASAMLSGNSVISSSAGCDNQSASPTLSKDHQTSGVSSYDDDSLMRSTDNVEFGVVVDAGASNPGKCTGNSNFESEYSAMVASVYENEVLNCETASVASDLTRMYVSDEDEKH